LLGSYRELMISIRANLTEITNLCGSGLKNLSTQWIETPLCIKEPKAIPKTNDLIWFDLTFLGEENKDGDRVSERICIYPRKWISWYGHRQSKYTKFKYLLIQ